MAAVRKEAFVPEAFMWIDDIQYLVIDLFCGAGGTTIGFEEANKESNRLISKVIACVNHDHLAIKSHWSNHPEVEHFEEDIRLLNPFGRLKRMVEIYRAFYPNAKVILWASLECTNFSKAKGGQPRDADSRTLADHLHNYVLALEPDYIKIENVVEFMSWGPLDEKGKPVSKKSGQDWMRWRKEICEHGYFDDWRELNSADFGALTSRNRLFGCFAKPGLSITWPEPTHSKRPERATMFGQLKKWEPVKKALDFADEGESIFNRKQKIPKVQVSKKGYSYSKLNKYNEEYKTFGPIPDDLSTKTMQRLFMGCVKHIAGGKEAFVSRYYGGNPEHRNHVIDEPAGTITTNNRFSIVQANFLSKAFSGNPDDKNISTEVPAGAITTKDHHQLVQAESFLTMYNSNRADTGGNNGKSVEEPAPVSATRNNPALVQAFITKSFSSHNNKSVNSGSSIEEPCPTIPVQSSRIGLAKVDFLVNYNHSSNSNSIDETGPCVTASDKLGKAQVDFISRYNGVNGGKHDNSHSVDGPVGALGTGDNHAKICAHFIQRYYSQGGQHNSIDEPAATLTTKSRLSKVSATFIDQRNGTNPESRSSSVDEPAKTLTQTGGNQQLVQADFFIEKKYNGSHNHQSIDQPAGAILQNDKHNLVTAEKWLMNTNYNNVGSSLEDPSPVITADRHHHYLVNPSWVGNTGSIDAPCPVVIARQDKSPLYLITCTEGPIAVPVYEGDCEWTIKLKEFMALYGISDIKMRMLKVPELIQIQGFPTDYILLGNQTDQKKFIGNAVHPLVPKHWIWAMSEKQKRMAA